jgi:hypothetical protein
MRSKRTRLRWNGGWLGSAGSPGTPLSSNNPTSSSPPLSAGCRSSTQEISARCSRRSGISCAAAPSLVFWAAVSPPAFWTTLLIAVPSWVKAVPA